MNRKSEKVSKHPVLNPNYIIGKKVNNKDKLEDNIKYSSNLNNIENQKIQNNIKIKEQIKDKAKHNEILLNDNKFCLESEKMLKKLDEFDEKLKYNNNKVKVKVSFIEKVEQNNDISPNYEKVSNKINENIKEKIKNRKFYDELRISSEMFDNKKLIGNKNQSDKVINHISKENLYNKKNIFDKQPYINNFFNDNNKKNNSEIKENEINCNFIRKTNDSFVDDINKVTIDEKKINLSKYSENIKSRQNESVENKKNKIHKNSMDSLNSNMDDFIEKVNIFFKYLFNIANFT